MIDIQHLFFSYSKRQKLFEDLNLQLDKGRIYGLLGKNGTGKTTLLKLMLGSLFPKEGSIRIQGFDPRKRDPQMLADIYYLPEEYELPTVSINIFERIYGAFYPDFDKDKFYHLLDEFEVGHDGLLHKLSFGQKKKVLISFGIACGVRILLFDEPTNGLDIPSKSQFRKVIASNLSKSQTVVISTHQVRDLTNLIDAVIILEEGHIIFEQDLHQISEKLLFQSSLQSLDEYTSIYSEMVPGGYMHVVQNKDGLESDIDLEVLFNAILKKREQINQLF